MNSPQPSDTQLLQQAATHAARLEAHLRWLRENEALPPSTTTDASDEMSRRLGQAAHRLAQLGQVLRKETQQV